MFPGVDDAGNDYEYLVDGGWLVFRMRKTPRNIGRLMAEVKARASKWRKNNEEWQDKKEGVLGAWRL